MDIYQTVPLSKLEPKSFRDKIIYWGKQNFVSFPWRFSRNKWHALVAEIMLQRTKAEQVLPVYLLFCKKYPSAKAYVENPLNNLFGSLGLVWRNKQFKELAKLLSQENIPTSKKGLMELPGVGDYIASAFRSLHMGKRDVIIDSNVVRLYGRFWGFGTDGETRRKKWFKELADALTPKRRFKDYNYGLIDFTRAICKPRPICSACPLSPKCDFYKKNTE